MAVSARPEVRRSPAEFAVGGVGTGGYAQEMLEIGRQLAHLDCLARARLIARAIYFASRIERSIDRGHGAPAANEDGLATACPGMTATSN